MGRTWSALALGCLILHATAAPAQTIDVQPGQPAAPGMPPMPPLPPMPPQTPRTPYDQVPVPSFGDPPAANAFDGMPSAPADDTFICGSIGFLALQRITSGDETFAVLDPGDPAPPPFAPPFFDFGGPFPTGAPPVGSLQALKNKFNFGITASIGVHRDTSLFEISGFYMPNVRSSGEINNPARLDLPFAQFPPPLGFEGNNGLWMQADQIKLAIENRLINVECNYCFSSNGLFGWCLGVRYLDLRERFSIFTDDDGLTVQPADVTNQADYRITSSNHIIGQQLGLFLRLLLDEPDAYFIASVKTVPAINFNEMETSLVRGDGFQGPSGSREKVYFSPIVEANLMLEFALTQWMRLRFGYQAMVVLNVPLAQNQVQFNPQDTTTPQQGGGVIFFHGPSMGLQF